MVSNSEVCHQSFVVDSCLAPIGEDRELQLLVARTSVSQASLARCLVYSDHSLALGLGVVDVVVDMKET